MLTFGQGDEDPVSLTNHSALEDNGHDARLADQIPGFIPIEDGLQQTRLNGVKLVARISQSCDFDLGRLAELENRPLRKPKQVNPARGDIFAHLTGQYGHSLGSNFVVQFAVDQMHLPQIGLRRVFGNTAAVLHGGSHVRITFYAETFKQGNLWLTRLDQGVFGAAVDGCDHRRREFLCYHELGISELWKQM
jgi:hypothetical protein